MPKRIITREWVGVQLPRIIERLRVSCVSEWDGDEEPFQACPLHDSNGENLLWKRITVKGDPYWEPSADDEARQMKRYRVRLSVEEV